MKKLILSLLLSIAFYAAPVAWADDIIIPEGADTITADQYTYDGEVKETALHDPTIEITGYVLVPQQGPWPTFIHMQSKFNGISAHGRYTVDGTIPTLGPNGNGRDYQDSKNIVVNPGHVVRLISFQGGYEPSNVVSIFIPCAPNPCPLAW